MNARDIFTILTILVVVPLVLIFWLVMALLSASLWEIIRQIRKEGKKDENYEELT